MKKLIVVLIVILFIASLSFGCKKSVESESSGKLSDAGTEAYQDEELPDSVPWQDAEYYIGKTIAVYGPVVDIKHFGAEGEGTTFLYIGKVYPEPKAFTVWINDLISEKFPQDPKTYYYGKNISVTGLILESNGGPYIEITDPNQISGGEEIAEIALEEEILSISWDEAKYHIGEIVTVYGPVITTYYDEDVYEGSTFFNIGKDYPDLDRFSVWINILNRAKFSPDPEIYYYGYNISVTGQIIEIDGVPYMEVTEPDQIIIIEETKEVVEETFEEETADETLVEVSEETEPVKETVKETEPAGDALTVPTISLEIIEGPAFSQAGDSTCYYRIRANVTGNPSPAVSFNKDDSQGSLGKNIVQVNLHNKGEAFTLEANASNTQGSASASITLTHTCPDHIPIIIQNNTGGSVSINLSGPGSYSFNISPGQKIIYVIPGTYNYKGIGCGGPTLSGTENLSSPDYEWKWWCE